MQEPPQNLFTLADYGSEMDAVAYCGDCSHRGALDLAALIAEHGPNASASKVESQITCSNCGTRGASVIVRSARDQDGA